MVVIGGVAPWPRGPDPAILPQMAEEAGSRRYSWTQDTWSAPWNIQAEWKTGHGNQHAVRSEYSSLRPQDEIGWGKGDLHRSAVYTTEAHPVVGLAADPCEGIQILRSLFSVSSLRDLTITRQLITIFVGRNDGLAVLGGRKRPLPILRPLHDHREDR